MGNTPEPVDLSPGKWIWFPSQRTLAKLGRIDVVLSELRKRWATMRSVVENNTLQEAWQAEPDSTSQFSHCAVAPLYVLFMDIAGIRAAEAGFAKVAVRPQLGDLRDLEVTARTVKGDIEFAAKMEGRGHRVKVRLPRECEGEVVLEKGSECGLPRVGGDGVLERYRMKAGG